MSRGKAQVELRDIAAVHATRAVANLRPVGRMIVAGGFSHRTPFPNDFFALQGERIVRFPHDPTFASRAPIRAKTLKSVNRWLKPPATINRPPGEEPRGKHPITLRTLIVDCHYRHFLATMLSLFVSTAAVAQSTQPSSRFDDQPVRSSRAESTAPATRSAVNQLPTVTFDWPRVALALGGVIAIIFTLRWGAKKYLGVAAATGAGKVVRVLGRATIGPRQQIVMLQIGKRVIIAADNAGQLSTLSQVTEADEVASLLGQFEETNTAAPAGLFKKWFNKAEDDFEAPDPEDQLVLAGAPKLSASQPTEDSSLQTARGEIASLMDKAREMARQIRRNG